MEKHLEKSHIKCGNDQLKAYRGGEGTKDWVVGWPAQPGFLGTFLVFALNSFHVLRSSSVPRRPGKLVTLLLLRFGSDWNVSWRGILGVGKRKASLLYLNIPLFPLPWSSHFYPGCRHKKLFHSSIVHTSSKQQTIQVSTNRRTGIHLWYIHRPDHYITTTWVNFSGVICKRSQA